MTRLKLLLCLAMLSGCRSVHDADKVPADYQPFVQQLEYPQAREAFPVFNSQAFAAPPTLENYRNLQPWKLSLNEAVRIALANSDVIRDVGGRVLTSSGAAATTAGGVQAGGTTGGGGALSPTIFDPAIQEMNPFSGVEAALSQFDAQLAASLIFNRNEDKFNNFFQGAGLAGLGVNRGDFNLEVNKTAATGTRFAARNITNYARANQINPTITRFRSFYNTAMQAEVRHPLLQGGGVEFNRIAGVSRQPGIYTGVLITRINSDITVTQFEIAIRNLCLQVEQTYWQLYRTYRELDTRQRSLAGSGLIWREEKLRLDAGQARPDDEANARQRYFEFKNQVETALVGGGGRSGVFQLERQLRRLMGLPPADGRLIQPTTAPTLAKVVFDWPSSLAEGLQRRAELRQQRWQVRSRELELTAARNYAMARLDFVGQYTFKGFGDDLFGMQGVPEGSAVADFFGGDLQDWRLGLELTTPIGNRIGHVAVRHAQLELARARVIARDQELQVSHELAAALAELSRAYANMRSAFNSRQAGLDRLKAIRARSGEVERVFFLLDAQRLLADSESAMHVAVADYNLALLDVEYRRGTLLSYMDVSLAEGPWSAEAHASAASQGRYFAPKRVPRANPDQTPVSRGALPQQRHIDALPDSAITPDLESLPPAPADADDVELLRRLNLPAPRAGDSSSRSGPAAPAYGAEPPPQVRIARLPDAAT